MGTSHDGELDQMLEFVAVSFGSIAAGSVEAVMSVIVQPQAGKPTPLVSIRR